MRIVVHDTCPTITAQHSTAQHSIAQRSKHSAHGKSHHSTAQHSTAQHRTLWHSTAQHITAWPLPTAQHITAWPLHTAQHITAWPLPTAQHITAWPLHSLASPQPGLHTTIHPFAHARYFTLHAPYSYQPHCTAPNLMPPHSYQPHCTAPNLMPSYQPHCTAPNLLPGTALRVDGTPGLKRPRESNASSTPTPPYQPAQQHTDVRARLGPSIFPIFLPHFHLYEVVSLHICVLPYKYRKTLKM